MKQRHRLDEVDRRILYEYSGDARMTYTELAGKVGLSATQCLRRIRALEKSHVIQGYVAVVDRTVLNLPMEVFVEVRLPAADEKGLKRFESAVDRMPDIVSCWRTAGDVDYLVEGFVPNPLGYERLLGALAEIAGVAIVRTHLVLRQVKESLRLPACCLETDVRMGTALSLLSADHADRGGADRAPGPPALSDSAVVVDQEVRKHRLDDIDRRILRALASNCRISNVELARQAGLSPAPCLRRVQALEAAGAITTYYVVIDFDALDLIVFFVFVHAKAQGPGWHDDFERALGGEPAILQGYRTNGASDYILQCVARGLGGVEQLLSNKLFARQGIETVQCMLSLRYCIRVDLGKLHGASEATGRDVRGGHGRVADAPQSRRF